MYREVLNQKQLKLLPFLKFFRKDFFLVGGTAMTLYLGHRKSVDFGLFIGKKFSRKLILKKIRESKLKINSVLVDNEDEYTIVLNGVKFTFLFYPFVVNAEHSFEGFVKLPALVDLAAMKAYALGRRATLKDYVDMYFVLKKHVSFAEIVKRAKKIFENFLMKSFLGNSYVILRMWI